MKNTDLKRKFNRFLNESNSITLKRGYGNRKPVVVGANAPIRNQILTYVAESGRVSAPKLKNFIAGLNEGNSNPNAAANMWLRRNKKFFISENRNGRTYFKLSRIGKRLLNAFEYDNIYENNNDMRNYKNSRYSRKRSLTETSLLDQPLDMSGAPPEEDDPEAADEILDYMRNRAREVNVNRRGVVESEKADFIDPKTGKPGIVDDEDEEINESRKRRIQKLIENIREREAGNFLFEDDEEDKGDDDDDLSFDDLDLSTEEGGGEEDEDKEKEGDEKEEGEEKDEEEEEKVEITEFILTVDDVDSAIEELKEKEVDAKKVPDPEKEDEYIEDEISVPAEDWDKLKDWLEEKGVDVEEMFGGEIEVEDEEGEGEEGEEGEDIDLDLDNDEEGKEGEGDEDLDLDLDLDSEVEESAVELPGEEPEVEESLTGMENHEDEMNNLIKGAKTVIIKY